eukprot:1438588-Karenia_brevis.AAC.1
MDNKPLVDGMNGLSVIGREDLRPLCIRTARSWEKLLTRITQSPCVPLEFVGMSPLRWVNRSCNVQADYLCHYTLSIKTTWKQASVDPARYQLMLGDDLFA